MTLEEAQEVIRKKWGNEGDCGSCGWHDSLESYGEDYIDQEDIDRGWVEFGCHSKDDEDAGSHRGTKISLTDDPCPWRKNP